MAEIQLQGCHLRTADEERATPIDVGILDDFHVRFDCRPGFFHRYFGDEFRSFLVEDGGRPDISFAVAPFSVSFESPAQRFDEYVVGPGWVYARFIHKRLARWRFLVVGLDTDHPRVYFWGSRMCRWFVQSRVVEPLIRHQLSRRGWSLFHSASVAKDGKGILLPAVRHTGKTITCFYLLDRGYEFLADDYSLVSETGLLHRYPRRINLFRYHLRTNPALGARLTFGRKWNLFAKAVLRRLTCNFANLACPVHVQELYPDTPIGADAKLTHVICLSSGFGSEVVVRDDLSPVEAATLTTANSRREAREFWNALLAAEYAGIEVSAEGWFARERAILEKAFAGAKCREVTLPHPEHLDANETGRIIAQLCEGDGR